MQNQAQKRALVTAAALMAALAGWYLWHRSASSRLLDHLHHEEEKKNTVLADGRAEEKAAALSSTSAEPSNIQTTPPLLMLEAASTAESERIRRSISEVHIVYGTHNSAAAEHAGTVRCGLKSILSDSSAISIKVTDLRHLSVEDVRGLLLGMHCPDRITIFLMSTFVKGTPPPSAETLFSELESFQNTNALGQFCYSVGALGSAPRHPNTFAKAGRDLDRWLQKSGGQRLLPVCPIDASNDPQQIVLDWVNEMAKRIQSECPIVKEPMAANCSPNHPAVLTRQPREIPQSIVILFGTESGTSEAIAEDMKRHIESTHVGVVNDIQVADIEYFKSYPPAPYKLFIFVIATYGDGDPSESAAMFWREMKSKALNDSGIWQGVGVCVIGLGNAAYRNHCGFAVKLTRKLKTIKAVRICDLLKMNDGDDLDNQLEVWLSEKFDPAFRAIMRRPSTAASPPASKSGGGAVSGGGLSGVLYSIRSPDQEFTNKTSPASAVVKPIFGSRPASFTFTSCIIFGRPAPGQRRSYRVFVQANEALDPSTFYPGSTFAFFPPMDEKVTSDLLSIFQEGDVPLTSLRKNKLVFHSPQSTVPCGTTIEELVASLTNFGATPSLKWMRMCLLPALQRDHPLVAIFDDALYHKVIRPGPVTLCELLLCAQSLAPTKLSLNFLLHSIPRQAPRHYTVASTIDLRTPNKFELIITESFMDRDSTAPLLGTSKRLGRLDGLASAVLSRMIDLDLPQCVRGISAPATFKRDTWARGGVWVANGSGIAASLAFIDARRRQKCGQRFNPAILFYGCRSSSPEDFLGHHEILEAVRDGILLAAFFAFSRNPRGQRLAAADCHASLQQLRESLDDPPALHVNHVVARNAPAIRDIILGDPTSALVLCGSKGMGTAVWGAVLSVFQPEGVDFLSELVAQGRVLSECW